MPPVLSLLPLLAAAAGCPEADPLVTADAAPGTPDAGGTFCDPPPAYAEDLAGCTPLADDYQPRVNGSADDTWPACISDDNTYHRIQESISSIARVAAFEQIATLLWEDHKLPSPQDFLDARAAYAQDQGLDSRVQRREDVHYPAPDGGARCSDPGIPDQYPDRCVGPARLLPILNDAFEQGVLGATPRVHAARIQGALVWFLYVSPLSETTSCTTKPQDCDSAWAYYTGGTPRDAPLGLSRAVAAIGPETHERAYDGALAVRCWRNLDNETGEATDLAMRDRALGQYDRAMLRGVALIVRQRFAEVACSTGDVRDAAHAFLQVVVPLLDRASRERDATAADVVLAEAEKADPAAIDADAAIAALDLLYPCP